MMNGGFQMNKEKDSVMVAIEQIENVCCGSTANNGFSALLNRFEAMSDGFCYSVVSDDVSKRWYIQNNADKSKSGSAAFGSSVVNLIDLHNAMNPESEFYDMLNKDGISDDEMKSVYEKNKDDIDYLKRFLSESSNFNLQDRFNVWNVYRHFFVFNDLWHLVKECRDSSLYNYALQLVSNHAHKQMQHDKVLWDIGGKVVSADTYNMNGLSYLFEFDLYKVLIDGNCGVFHVCQRCGKSYFDNDKKTKYCFDCRENPRQILNENRKSNEARYLHKRVQDRFTQFSKGSGGENYLQKRKQFTIESNYYWSICQGKKPKTKRLNNYLNITTKKQYIEWLKNQLHN